MTYPELKTKTEALKKERDRVYGKYTREITALELDYIAEHAPLKGVKRFQRVTARLRVTEETRGKLTEAMRKRKRYQLGREYTVEGVFNGWSIGEDGSVRPCFYGGPTYDREDELLSVTLSESQPEGHCSKCRCQKDGLCYMMGGQDISPKCAVWEITDEMTVCPKYEEVLEGGLWEHGERHCPNVTKVVRKGKTSYRVYSLNWNYFTEYGEPEVWLFFTKEARGSKE